MAVTSLGLIGVTRRSPGILEDKRGTALDEAEWEDGKVLLDLSPGNTFATASLPPGPWILMAKAKDVYGNYSVEVAKTAINVVNQNDVVFSQEQSPDWPGLLSGFVRHEVSGSLIPTSKKKAYECGWELFDKFVPYPVNDSIYTAPEFDVGFDYPGLRIWAQTLVRAGYGEAVAPDPANSIDYRLDGYDYDGYESWTIGKVQARYIKQRVILNNEDGAGALRSFKPVVDAIKRIESFVNRTIAPGGSVINFSSPFINLPGVKITPGANLKPWYSDLSNTSVKVHLSDSADDDVGGTSYVEISGA